jgi:hypothetical protein
MMILKNLLSNVNKECVFASKGMEEFSAIETDMLMIMTTNLKRVK